MAKINGTLGVILSGTDTILYTTSCSLNINQNLPDSSNKGSSGWAEHIQGQRDWSMDFDGMYDTVGSGFTGNEIIALIIARTASAQVSFSLDGGTTGWRGTGTFQSASLSADLESPVTFSGSIVGTGALAAY